MHWTVKLDCEDCGATVSYEDERPDWQGEGEERHVTCPSCGGNAYVPTKPRLDLNLGTAFDVFRPKGRRQA